MTIGRKLKFQGRVESITIDLLSGDVSRYIEELDLKMSELRNAVADIERSFFQCQVPNSLIKKCSELFQSQVSGETSRCFRPGYELIFTQSQKDTLKVQLCWECNWIKVFTDKSEPKWFAFDSTTTQSKELLSLLRKVVENEM